MPPTSTLNPIRTLALCVAALSVLPVAAQTADLEKLVAESPFAPVGGPAPVAAATETLELRGVVIADGRISLNIFDSSTKSAVWVATGETGHPFVVRSFDPSQNVATVEWNRKTIALPLKQNKTQLASMPVNVPPQMQMVPPPAPAPGGQPGVPVPVVAANNAVQTDQARLQAIAQEIRRRRAMRAEAQAQSNPADGGQPAPAPPARN